MEQKKHLKTILIALLMVGALVGFGYGISTALKNSTATELNRRQRFRDTDGSGKLQ